MDIEKLLENALFRYPSALEAVRQQSKVMYTRKCPEWSLCPIHSANLSILPNTTKGV